MPPVVEIRELWNIVVWTRKPKKSFSDKVLFIKAQTMSENFWQLFTVWLTSSKEGATELYTVIPESPWVGYFEKNAIPNSRRSEEHTSELQSRGHIVCRLLLEK